MNVTEPRFELIHLESLYTHAPPEHPRRDGRARSLSGEASRGSTSTFATRRHASYDTRTSLLAPSSGTYDPEELSDAPRKLNLNEKAQRYWTSMTQTRIPKGWRFGAAVAALMSSCALTINLTIVIVAWVWIRHRGYESNIAPVYTGKCTTVDNFGLVIHLAINIISTLLLGASNYCMQIVCAPTRKDIDRAHEHGSWLDIGVQSISNLKRTKKVKLYAWLTLGLSSVPLHLIYNSTFFTSLGINAYDVYFATDGFEKGEPYETRLFGDSYLESRGSLYASYYSPATHNDGESFSRRLYYDYFSSGDNADDDFSRAYPLTYITNPSLIQRNAPKFERLNNSDCMKQYGEDFVSDRRNLILVVAEDANRTMSWTNTDVGGLGGPGEHNNVDRTEGCNDNSTAKVIDGPYANEVIVTSGSNRPDAYYWICSHDRYTSQDTCSNHLSSLRANPDSWKVYGMPIQYCLSERVEPQCSFNVSLSLLTVVIIFNFIKVCCATLVVLRIKDKPLITLGDAVSTFIERPDETTKGLCLVNKGMVESEHWKKQREVLIKTPDTYKLERIRWYKAASKGRWLLSFFMVFLGVGIILTLLIYAISDLRQHGPSDLGYLWRLGLGKIHSSTLIQGWAIPTTGDSAITGTVLIANLPQALLSCIYLVVNGLITNMLLAFEWSKFASKRRTLRVSEPRGSQRSTYFLQIPYRYGLPLAILSSLLHWFVSQSIFLAKVDGLDPRGHSTKIGNVTTCGYSPFGMISTTIGGLLLLLFAVFLGRQKFDPGMPLAGSCSIAISAACHVPEGTSELEPLMWGVIPEHPEDVGFVPQHCSFANERLEKPVSGKTYA